MIIKKVKLNNIRSYANQEIEFPFGSTLLAGDIGSGKSSILLAIEFALFGIRRGQLSGSALLRHGKKEGSVELNFDVDGQDILIKRTLKRSKDKVEQNSGYIIRNDLKKIGTAIELKAMILDLLRYPKELITKTKNLIYRYTVYTPQEEMKQILFEEKDVRLDTLRKVFNIDKYKRIRENTVVFVRKIKESKKEIEGKISDLEIKKKSKQERETEVAELRKKIEGMMPDLDDAKKKIEEKKRDIAKAEDQIKKLTQLKNDFDILEVGLTNKIEERNKNKKEIENLESEIITLKDLLKDRKEVNIENIKIKIKENHEKIVKFENDIREFNKNINEFKAKKANSEGIVRKIIDLDECPLCKQNVSQDHKSGIKQEENKKMEDFEMHIQGHEDLENQREIEIDSMKKELDKLREIMNQAELVKDRETNLSEKEKRKESLNQSQEKLKQEIGDINAKKLELNKKIDAMKNLEESYKKIKQELDSFLEKGKSMEIEKKSYETKKETIEKLLLDLSKEIEEKEKAKERLSSLNELQQWLEDYFANLMINIEKHVMLSLHQKFDELFQDWFNVLIEDESIQVRLDDQFTPVIEQNGYETDLENLSGGEKTSCALAYRLSLNKVINDLVDIKTKDMIILDEPTDGFSTEQLDKIRVVLDQLDMKQVILVSHESKIESFVDNVIRINKEEHSSSVI